MKVLFFVFAIVILYTYVGYPILLTLLCLLRSHKLTVLHDFLPTVTLIIAAYNEENIIQNKIENSLNLDYPKEKLEIIVVSDGSTDNTNKIVKEYEDSRIKLNYIEKRVGKTSLFKARISPGFVFLLQRYGKFRK